MGVKQRHTFSKLHEIKNLFRGRDNFFFQPSNKYPSLSKKLKQNSEVLLENIKSKHVLDKNRSKARKIPQGSHESAVCGAQELINH